MVQTKSKQSLNSHRISTQLSSSGSAIISAKSNAEFESNTLYYLKIIIIASCLAMLTYQTIELGNDYYKYPTSIQVVIEKPSSESISLPGVTVCGIRNDLKQNGGKNTIRPTFHQVLSDDIKKVVSCEIRKSDVCDNKVTCDKVSIPVISTVKSSQCITFFSQVRRTLNLTKVPNYEMESNNVFLAHFEIAKQNISLYSDFYLIVHPTSSLPDYDAHLYAAKKSAITEKNRELSLIFHKDFIYRKEPPYDTNCRDYIKERKNNGDEYMSLYSNHYIPASRRDCMDECFKRLVKEKCSCLPKKFPILREDLKESKNETLDYCQKPKIDLGQPLDRNGNQTDGKPIDGPDHESPNEPPPHHEKPCYRENQISPELMCEISIDMNECKKVCRDDCKEEMYSFELFSDHCLNESRLPQEERINDHKLDNRIYLGGRFTEEISYRHKEKWGDYEFFAALGGLAGLWMGASVLAVYQLLSNAINYLRKFAKRKNNYDDDASDVKPLTGRIASWIGEIKFGLSGPDWNEKDKIRKQWNGKYRQVLYPAHYPVIKY